MTEEIEEQELDAPAVQKLNRAYHAAAPGEAREARWEAFTDEERWALNDIGVAGPMDATDEGEVVRLDDDALRQMDPEARREAKAEFEQVTKRAEGQFSRGLARLMRGELDASQSTLDEVAEIRDQVEKVADPAERSVLLQKGALLIESLKDPDQGRVFNPNQIKKTRTYFDGLTRRHMFEEVDLNGNSRTSALTRDEHAQQYRAPKPEPLPDSVSVEEFVKWDVHKRLRFVREHPEAYQGLLQATDH